MMITRETMAFIKRKNVSKDAEKTKQRVEADYSSLRNSEKSNIFAISGLSRSSIYLTVKTGRLSARLALAMAHTLNVSPLYYTGETDDREELTEANLRYFLNSADCSKPSGGQLIDNVLFTLRERLQESFSSLTESDADFINEYADQGALIKAAHNLDEYSAAAILQEILFREKTDETAVPVAGFVKRCLLMGMLLLPIPEDEEE